ncbi:hypothetical protein G6732_06385 [Polynucleobacter paneuropaeus]|nr:hypothetical protein [Polynucleobacter paneuropaeus]
MTKLISLIFAVGFLVSGCATKLTPQEISTSSVMPESVAVKIFQKYGIPDIRKPFSGGLPPICGGGIISDISITEVFRFSYLPKSKQVIMRSRGFLTDGRCPVGSVLYNVQTEQDAKELLQASIALGAKVDQVYILKAFWE